MIARNISQKLLLLIVVGLLVGCAPAEPPQVGDIQAQPSTTITTGKTASLTIQVAGTDLKFEWSALRGSLTDPTQPNVIYTAPSEAGLDTVTVKVSYKGGQIIKTINFDVEPLPTPTATVIDTPIPENTPTPTAAPEPIVCNLPPVTPNLFPELAQVDGQYPIYGPVDGEMAKNFSCEAVYDIVHNHPMSVHIKYKNVNANYGWWGIATSKGYDASGHEQVCFWAYAQNPNQSVKVKMKDTSKKEDGVIVTVEAANKWEQICTDISKFTELGINVEKMDNINLGFETGTGSTEIWVADFEFK